MASLPIRRFFFLVAAAALATFAFLHTTAAKVVPFHTCPGIEDKLGVTTIDLEPVPAVAGQPLVITVKGTTTVGIDQGTRVHMAIREGNLPAPPEDYVLCSSFLDGTTCPVPAGTTSRAQFVYNVTRLAPTGRATSTVTTFDAKGVELSCVKLEVDVVRQRQQTTAIKALWEEIENQDKEEDMDS